MMPAGSSLSDWLTWLETLSPKEIDLGLDRVRCVLDRLAPDLPDHVFLVAGTNGKGSSVAMTDAILRAAGYAVGTYTSPHVLRFNERIAVGGTPVTDDRIVAAFECVEASRHDVPLTYFEFATLAAMVIFASSDLDVWVLEIGLGGRLDACNAVEPTASLITNVSLDHCEWLGDDVETIAREKAGIMRQGVPTVFGSRDVPRTLRKRAEEVGARLLLLGRDFDYAMDANDGWRWTGRSAELLDLPAPGLSGAFQVGNAAAVLTLIEVSGLADALDGERLRRVLPELALIGRQQAVCADGVDWLLDVAHNTAGATVLADTLAAQTMPGRTWAIAGMLDDKDVEGIAVALNKVVDHWIAVTAASPRAVPADELARRIANACGRPCRIGESIGEAMHYARCNVSENDRILVTGSFYTVGPALQNLELYSRPLS
jgi:dihydrofolate synthase/folylpolyglutamate synthase